MIDQKLFNELNEKISSSIPDEVKATFKDFDQNIKAIIQSALAKVDMVPRDEFDAQCKVLARTRQKLESLEKKIDELEQQLLNK